jgi:hypothetical protein
MAKQAQSKNGHTRLDEAMALVLNGQAAMQQAIATMVANQATFVAEMSEIKRDMRKLERETDSRFAGIDAKFTEVIRILNEHTRLFDRLPEAVRDKIGFKAT